MSGMMLLIQLVMILVCSMLGMGVPILQNSIICVILKSRKTVSGSLCCIVLLCAGWLLDGLGPIVDLLRVLPGEGKKRKQNI